MSDDAEIRDLVARFARAWNAHDPDAFAALFAPDGEFTNVVGRSAQGRDRIREFHAPRFATAFRMTRMTSEKARIRALAPDLASVDLRWGMPGAVDATGAERPPRHGVVHWVVRRGPDGWEILIMHNTEMPPGP